jgi:hypothetical protein
VVRKTPTCPSLFKWAIYARVFYRRNIFSSAWGGADTQLCRRWMERRRVSSRHGVSRALRSARCDAAAHRIQAWDELLCTRATATLGCSTLPSLSHVPSLTLTCFECVAVMFLRSRPISTEYRRIYRYVLRCAVLSRAARGDNAAACACKIAGSLSLPLAGALYLCICLCPALSWLCFALPLPCPAACPGREGVRRDYRSLPRRV